MWSSEGFLLWIFHTTFINGLFEHPTHRNIIQGIIHHLIEIISSFSIHSCGAFWHSVYLYQFNFWGIKRAVSHFLFHMGILSTWPPRMRPMFVWFMPKVWEAKLLECTFKPRINQNWKYDIPGESGDHDYSNRFEQLFLDAESRRRRREKYMQWYPEGLAAISLIFFPHLLCHDLSILSELNLLG